MTAADGPEDAQAIAREAHALWEQKAAFWDERMVTGTRLHRELLRPTVEALLELRPGETVLDVACGNGQLSRRLAELGARVVGCDFSAELIERARARTDAAEPIEYHVMDATDQAQLLRLGQHQFDAAVCNMALMDMPTVDPLLAALRRLLKPGGRFVFSVMHPCFTMPGSIVLAERGDREGQPVTTQALKLTRYQRVPPEKGLGIVGEPVPHYYFHRPLSDLLGAGFRAGLVLDALAEPTFDGEPSPDPLDWTNLRQFPFVLVARLRLPPMRAPSISGSRPER